MNEFGEVVEISEGIKNFIGNYRTWGFRDHEKTTLIFPDAQKPKQILDLTAKFNALNVGIKPFPYLDTATGVSLPNATYNALFSPKRIDQEVVGLGLKTTFASFLEVSLNPEAKTDGLLLHYPKDGLLRLPEFQIKNIEQLCSSPLLAAATVVNGIALFFINPIDGLDQRLESLAVRIDESQPSIMSKEWSKGGLTLLCLTINDNNFERLFLNRAVPLTPPLQQGAPPPSFTKTAAAPPATEPR